MPFIVFLLFCLSALLAAPTCQGKGVLKIPVQTHRLALEEAGEIHEKLIHYAAKERPSGNDRALRMNPKFELSASTGVKFNATARGFFSVYVANITIGTPGQPLRVMIDPFMNQELCVLGIANITDKKVSGSEKLRNFYDPSKSNTSEDVIGLQGGKFVVGECGRGEIAVDTVKIGKTKAKMAFGVIKEAALTMKEHYMFDGILGVNPFWTLPSAQYVAEIPYSKEQGNRKNIPQSAISQLLTQLDKPIMTWWQNETENGDIAQLTLGAEDTEHCTSSYVYVPGQEDHMEEYGGTYPVHLSSVVLEADSNGNAKKEYSLNMTIQFWHRQRTMYAPLPFFYAMTNATNAKYQRDVNEYVVDCDLSKHRNITLKIGGKGFDEDSTSRELILTPEAYNVKYSSQKKVCYLDVISWSETAKHIELGESFLNKHCVSFNAKDGTVGFSDVKSGPFDDYEYSGSIEI